MPRILRSQGIYKLGKPTVLAAPAVFVAPPLRVSLAAQARTRYRESQPAWDGQQPWATFNDTGLVRGFQRVVPLSGSDTIQLAPPPAATGFGTLLAVVRRRSTNTHAFLSLDAAGPSAQAEFYVAANPSNNLRFWNGSSDTQSSITLLENEGWVVVAVTKATGSATPRFHKCLLSAPSWTHSDATTGAVGNWSTSIASAWLGTSGDGFDFFEGEIALAAYWDGTALADVALEALTSVSAIATARPTALWSLNQPTAAGPVRDAIGTANQVAVTGTTPASANVPNFDTATALGQTTPWLGIRPPVVVGPGPTTDQTTERVRAAGQTRLDARRRATDYRLFPPAVVTPAAVFTAPPLRVRTVTARPRHTVGSVLRSPTTLRVFTGPESWLTKARPRPTTHVLRPAAVVLNPGVEQELRTLRVTLVRGRAGKTDYRLQPPAVVTAAVVFTAPPLRVLNVHTRPARTVGALKPPTTLQVFAGPRSVLTRARPRPTVHVLRPAAVVLVPSVELKEETLRVSLTRSRPVYRQHQLRPPTVLRVFSGPTSRLVTTRPRQTTYVLYAPTVVQPAAVFTAPPFRVAIVRIRPPRTRADLFPPAVVAPRPLAAPFLSRLVQTRPRHTIYRLEAPTVLAVFPGPRSELTRIRPQPTTTVLVPAQVVRNPHVEQQLRTLRVRLVRARPQPTTTLLRPPAVVLINPPVETDIHVVTVRGRRPKTVYRLFRPATLEPFSIQLREQTIRVRLVQIRPRHATLKLRPPAKLAVLTFQTGKPVLVRTRPRRTRYTLEPPTVLRVYATGESRLVTTRPRPTTTVLRPPTVLRVPSVEQQQRTLRAALVETRPRPTTTVLRPPTVVRQPPAVTQIRARLTPGRRPIARTVLNPPTVVTPFVEPVATFIRSWLTRIRPPGTLWQLFPPRRLRNVPGTACLTDHAAFDSCLTDQPAAEACLEDQGVEAVACLTNQQAYVACLVDMSAATATLRDEE